MHKLWSIKACNISYIHILIKDKEVYLAMEKRKLHKFIHGCIEPNFMRLLLTRDESTALYRCFHLLLSAMPVLKIWSKWNAWDYCNCRCALVVSWKLLLLPSFCDQSGLRSLYGSWWWKNLSLLFVTVYWYGWRRILGFWCGLCIPSFHVCVRWGMKMMII